MILGFNNQLGLGGKPAVAEKEYEILFLDLLLNLCDGFFILP